MADSKRLQIKKEITQLLELTPDYNLTNKVWRGRRRIGDESPRPCICIFEVPPEYIERAGPQVSKMPWVLGVQGYIEEGKPHPTDAADNFLAAVKQQLSVILKGAHPQEDDTHYMLSGLIADLEVDGGMVFEADETVNCAFFALKLTIEIVETLENPYG